MTPADPARREGRFAFLERIRDLPSLPQVLVGISRVAADPQADAADLAGVILKDQAMTMKVLRIANSARYAVAPNRVTTVSRAVVLMGFDSVRAMALGWGAFHMLSSLESGARIHEDFWRNSIAVAVVCEGLAGLVGARVPEEAFVAGLLHDVGKLVLAECDAASAAGVYGRRAEGPALLAAETRAFGVNHAEVAGELARRWELPAELERALEFHHRHYAGLPDDGGNRMAFLVGVAKSLVHGLGREDVDLRDVAAKTARLLRRPVGHVLRTLHDLPERIAEYAEFFEIEIEDLKAYALWLEDGHRRLHEEVEQLETRRRREEQREVELAAIRDVHTLLLDAAGAEAVAHRVLRAAREVCGARRGVVALLDRDGQTLRGSLGQGDVTPVFLKAFRFSVDGGGLLAAAVERGEALNVFDAELPYFARLMIPEEVEILDVPSFAVVPLQKGGKTAGLLYADRNAGDEPFGDEDLATLGTLSDLLSLALRDGEL